MRKAPNPHGTNRYYQTRRRYNLKRRYGITVEQFEALILKQKGLCPLCLREPERFVPDHDHVTGRVRGALCDGCNGALGSAEREGWMERVKVYLAA